MTSNWTPLSLASNDIDKKPYVWIDASSSNLVQFEDVIVAGLKDKFGNGYDLNSLQTYDQEVRALPRQNISNKINSLSTVSFKLPHTNEAIGLTQTKTIPLVRDGSNGHIVFVGRQGSYPGTLFGINGPSNVVTNPWTFKRMSPYDSGRASGTFAKSITSMSTLYTSNVPVTDALSNITVPDPATIFMLSISNVSTSNANFNGFAFNCESYLPDVLLNGPSNLNGWTGDFGEVIVWQEAAGANSNIQKLVEGYAAHKWGIQSFLSSSHPYKTTGPIFTSVAPAPFGSNGSMTPLIWLDSSDPFFCVTDFVVKINDKTGHGYSLQTRPEWKNNVVWPILGDTLNGLATTRFTQYAGLTQPTSIENLSEIFLVGRQSSVPSNGTWTQNLLGHDYYSDFGSSGSHFFQNSNFPTPNIYIVQNNTVIQTNVFPPADTVFLFTLKLPQTSSAKIVARFQGVSYDEANSNSGWCGDLGELILFRKQNLTENQSNLVMMYLANKWGLSLSDSSSVFPNVKPFTGFTPNSFKPIAWYDSSDSLVFDSLNAFYSLRNLTSSIPCVSNSEPQQRTPVFTIPIAEVDSKYGYASGLEGNACIERTINGLPAIYIDSQTTFLHEQNVVYGGSASPITNFFFVGRQGQYVGAFSKWVSTKLYPSSYTTTVMYQQELFESKIVNNNINQVPQSGVSTTYWKPTTKYQTIFANLGYGIAPNNTDFAHNPLLGGKVIPNLQLSGISNATTASDISNSASNSTNALNSTVFVTSNAYNSNAMLAQAACYSINQVGTARYQVTSQATQFVKAVTVTGSSVTFPEPSSTFLLSVNGIQENGFQATDFQGFFYDNMSGNDGWQGDFAEIVTFTKNLSPQEILLVEGYLATKWGLQSGLPTTHPFFYKGKSVTNECITGYSPVSFGSIGAIVNGTNDHVYISGLGKSMIIAKAPYDAPTFLNALNNNVDLPSGITIEIGGISSTQLLWKNSSSNTYSILASSQAAAVLGIEPSPSYFFLPPDASSATFMSPYPVLATVTSEIRVNPLTCGTFNVNVQYNNFNYSLIVDLAGFDFTAGTYSGNVFASNLQTAILKQTSVPLYVEWSNEVLQWRFDPRLFYQTNGSEDMSISISSTNEIASLLLGINVNTEVQLLQPGTYGVNLAVGDQSFTTNPNTFVVTTSNNTIIINSDTVALDTGTYSNADAFIDQCTYALTNQTTEPFSVTLKRGVIDGENVYVTFYTYNKYDATAILSSPTIEGDQLFGTPVNVSGCEISSTLSSKATYSTISVSNVALTISGYGADAIVDIQDGLYSESMFFNRLQEGLRAGFLTRGTASTFSAYNPVLSNMFINSLNTSLSNQTDFITVSNICGYLSWSNASDTAIVLVPNNGASSSRLGYNTSLSPVILWPSSYFSNEYGTVKTPFTFQLSNVDFILVQNLSENDRSFTRTINSPSPTVETYFLKPGKYLPYDFAMAHLNSFKVQGNYALWSNTTPTTYTQTISTSSPFVAMLLGIPYTSTENDGHIDLAIQVTLSDRRPQTVAASIGVNSTPQFTLSNSSYSPTVQSHSFLYGSFYSVNNFQENLISNIGPFYNTGLTNSVSAPNNPGTGLPSTLLWSNVLATDTLMTCDINVASYLGLLSWPVLSVSNNTTTSFPASVSYSTVYNVSTGVNDTFYVNGSAIPTGYQIKTLTPGTFTLSTFTNNINDKTLSLNGQPHVPAQFGQGDYINVVLNTQNNKLRWINMSTSALNISAATAQSALLLGIPLHTSYITIPAGDPSVALYKNPSGPVANQYNPVVLPYITIPTNNIYNSVIHIPTSATFSINDGSTTRTYTIPRNGTFTVTNQYGNMTFTITNGDLSCGSATNGFGAWALFLRSLWVSDLPDLGTVAYTYDLYFGWKNNSSSSTFTVSSTNSTVRDLLGIPSQGFTIIPVPLAYIETTPTGDLSIEAGASYYDYLGNLEENMNVLGLMILKNMSTSSMYWIHVPYEVNYNMTTIVTALNLELTRARVLTTSGIPTGDVIDLSPILEYSNVSSTLSITNTSSTDYTITFVPSAAYQLGASVLSNEVQFLFPASSSVLSPALIPQSYSLTIFAPTSSFITISSSEYSFGLSFVANVQSMNSHLDQAFAPYVEVVGTYVLRVQITNILPGYSDPHLTSTSRIEFTNYGSLDLTITADSKTCDELGITSPLLVPAAQKASTYPLFKTQIPVVNLEDSINLIINGTTVEYGNDSAPSNMTPHDLTNYVNGYNYGGLESWYIEYANSTDVSGDISVITFFVPSVVGYGLDSTIAEGGYFANAISAIASDGTYVTVYVDNTFGLHVGDGIQINTAATSIFIGNYYIDSIVTNTSVTFLSTKTGTSCTAILRRFGKVITATINKYVSVADSPTFFGTFEIVSAFENVVNVVKHMHISESAPSTAFLVYPTGYGILASTDPLVRRVSVRVAGDGQLEWNNGGPTPVSLEPFYGVPKTIPALKGNFSTFPFQYGSNMNVLFSLFGVVQPQPLPLILATNVNGSIEWSGTSQFVLTITPNANGSSTNFLGIGGSGTNGSIVLRPPGTIAPFDFDTNPLISSSQKITFYGADNTSAASMATLIDGTYNGNEFATMIQNSLILKTELPIVNVSFERSSKLTFTNTLPTPITLSATLNGAKILGFVDPLSTSSGTYSLVIPGNAGVSSPYSLGEISTLSVCVWDGLEACPINHTEVTTDSNELALPFAKRCAKPFSALLPQVITNVGLSTQKYACPIGTELIAPNQYADPDHPVCSYICEAPYFDSGTTCGYMPVYSPRDNKTLDILYDNAAANVVVTTATTQATSNSLQFIIFAVLVSFIIGLVISLVPVFVKNKPTESAAGSVLEKLLQQQKK